MDSASDRNKQLFALRGVVPPISVNPHPRVRILGQPRKLILGGALDYLAAMKNASGFLLPGGVIVRRKTWQVEEHIRKA
jgi:hypothetical protein